MQEKIKGLRGICDNCHREYVGRDYLCNECRNYPDWVCYDCGITASKGKQMDISTWHEGTCGVCGKKKAVTEPRDFFYPKFKQVDGISAGHKKALEKGEFA